MKKMIMALIWMLAIDFIVVAGGVGWLLKTGRLDQEKAVAIREIIFPATQPTTAPTTQPSGDMDSAQRLEQLLAEHAGQSPAEQLKYIRQSFDSQMAMLDLARRELQGLKVQVELAQQQLKADRDALDREKKKLEAREQEAQRLASDKGFQDSLELYKSLPAKQVKEIFLQLDDAIVLQYLQAMEPRTAAKITREFTTPQETERLKRIMEAMRTPQAFSGS